MMISGVNTDRLSVLRRKECRAGDINNKVGREMRDHGGFQPSLSIEKAEPDCSDAIENQGQRHNHGRDRHHQRR